MPAKRSKSFVLIVAGIALISLALGLTAYNLLQDKGAESRSVFVVEELQQAEGGGDSISAQALSSSTPMPTESVAGVLYIGVLRIPSLGLELPVATDWNYERLRSTPCRYAGSAYADNLVIAAHNYASHFGHLGDLSYGAEVSFTDVRGNVFVYEVASMEKLGPYDVQEMTDSEYDLTLFTCTLGGSNRVAVRCEEMLL